MKREIAEAIRNQNVIHLSYPPGDRTIEPYAVGSSAKGNDLLRAYQTSGASQSGEHEHWKLFRLDRIDRLDVTDETFEGPRPGYKRGDRAMGGNPDEEL